MLTWISSPAEVLDGNFYLFCRLFTRYLAYLPMEPQIVQ